MLLITLLEGSNEGVQKCIADYFASHKRSGFFRVAHETLVTTKLQLKDLKRLLKPKTQMQGLRSDSRTNIGNVYCFDGTVASQVRVRDTAVISRESHVMLLLRVLQLMCSSQYAPLQNLMQKQSSLSISYNLLGACTDLFGAVQPLANNLSSNRDPTPFLVLETQLLATLCDMSQGPNLQVLLCAVFFCRGCLI